MLAVFSKDLQVLGVIGIICALFVPIFGYWQQMILPGNLHWLIETAHLFIGFGALALIGVIGERFARRKIASTASTTNDMA